VIRDQERDLGVTTDGSLGVLRVNMDMKHLSVARVIYNFHFGRQVIVKTLDDTTDTPLTLIRATEYRVKKDTH
jgi:hypothetical protein